MSQSQLTLAADRNSFRETIGRVFLAALIFIGIMAISMLLPRALPGEMSAGEMTPHELSACASCLPTERIAAAGLSLTPERSALNVQFAAPPVNAALRIRFEGLAGEMTLQQSGAAWSAHGSTAVKPIGIAGRGDRLVVLLPTDASIAGFALSTRSGDVFPRSGFVPPAYPATPHFNASDVALLLILAASAWYGARRGFLVELSDLLVIATSLVIAATAYHPLAGLFEDLTGSPKAGAILGSGVLMLATGGIGFFLVRRHFARLGDHAPVFDPRAGAVLGAAAGCLRQLPVLAMVLAAGADLAILHWASANINSSILGSSLLHTWRALF